MRILVVSTYFPPQSSVGSLRPHSWAKRWSQLGHDVTVLTTTKEERAEVALNLDCSTFELIEVAPPWLYKKASRRYRSSSGGSGRGSTWKSLLNIRSRLGICNSCRMPDLIDGWVRPASRAAPGPWDLVVSTAGPYACHLVAERLEKRRWIADYRDLWVDSELFPGLWPFTWIERAVERRLMKKADRITTVSQPLADKLASRYGSPRVAVVENGFDPDDLGDLDPAPIFAADGRYRLLYTGMIYKGKRDPSPLFKAIRQLRGSPLLDRLEVLFVGHLLADLREQIEQYGVEKWVRILPLASRAECLRMQRDASALLFLEHSQSGALTGKLFEYLFASRPIWAIGVGPDHVASQLIEEARAGAILGQDVGQIAAHLERSLSEKLPFQPDTDVIDRFSRSKLADRMLDTVSTLL